MIVIKNKEEKNSIFLLKNSENTNIDDILIDMCAMSELQDKTIFIDHNGTETVRPDEGYKGLKKVNIVVDIPIDEFNLENKTLTITENGHTHIETSKGYDAIKSVDIDVNVESDKKIQPIKREYIEVPMYGLQTTVKPDEGYDSMEEVKLDISTNVWQTSLDKYINKNGDYTYDKTTEGIESEDFGGFNGVNLHVNVQPDLQYNKTVKITGNTTQDITADEGYDGLAKVTVEVDVPSSAKEEQKKTTAITQNGRSVVTPDAGKVLSEVEINVNVPSKEPVLQDKDVVISTEDVVDVVADGEYDGLSKVQVIPSTKEYNTTITSNGTHNINTGKDLYNGGTITVSVPSDTKKEVELKETIRENTTKTYTPNQGEVYNKVNITVDVPSSAKEEIELNETITSNGESEYTPLDGKVYSKVKLKVDVPTQEIKNQDKVIDIAFNGSQMIKADSGYSGLGAVTINTNVPQSSSGRSKFSFDFEDLYSEVLGILLSTASGRYSIDLKMDIESTYQYGGNLGMICKLHKPFTFEGDFINIKKSAAFRDTSITKFTGRMDDLEYGSSKATPSGNEISMFGDCGSLESFVCQMPKLINGEQMFSRCYVLSTFISSLPELTNGYYMFNECYALESFNTPMPKLNNGYQMFHQCYQLSAFNIDLPSLTNGEGMFWECNALKSFEGDLKAATNTKTMFWSCSALTTFKSDLSSLDSGTYTATNSNNPAEQMFSNCFALANVELEGTLNCAIDWTVCPLTVESMVNIMNAMVDLNGQASKRMTFGRNNINKLSDEQKAIATNKNWTLN